MRIISPSFILSILLLAFTLPAAAQTIHHVSPRSIEATVTGGDIVTETITIKNTYPYRISVYPSIHSLKTSIGSTTEQRIGTTSQTVLTEWLTMSRAGQRLNPGESTEVTVRFVVPRTVEAGRYTALLGFGQGIDRVTAETAVINGVAPGVVIRFDVPGKTVDTKNAGTVTVPPIIFAPDHKVILYRIQNPASGTVVPAGESIIFNKRGSEVRSLTINTNAAPVIQSEVLSEAKMTGSLIWPGRYVIKTRITFNNTELAAIDIEDDFWYLPWWWLIGFLVVILLLSVVVFRLLHRRFNAVPVTTTDGTQALPLHIYSGESEPEDHDISLR